MLCYLTELADFGIVVRTPQSISPFQVPSRTFLSKEFRNLQTLLSIISVLALRKYQSNLLAASGVSWICRSHPAVWGFNVTPTHNIYYLVGTVSAICWDGQNAINTRSTPEISYGYNFSNGVVSNCANTTSPEVDRIDRPMAPQAIQIFGNGSWQYRLGSVCHDLFPCFTFLTITNGWYA